MTTSGSTQRRRHFALTGMREGKRLHFPLRPGRNRVGRRSNLEVCLDTAGVSKLHAVLQVTADGVRVEDLASKNGTWVDGVAVAERAAIPEMAAVPERGVELRFGPVRLRLEEVAAAEAELAIDLRGRSSSGSSSSSSASSSSASVSQPADSQDTAARLTETSSYLGSHLEPDTETPPLRLTFPSGYLPAASQPMMDLYRQLEAVVDSDLPVLILGETGCGKEALARAVHASSPRRQAPFVALNCAALPRELLEAELFGVKAGVATGVQARAGKFQLAHGGTLFLDEVGDMPAELQGKVLRALQEKEVAPLGAAAPVPVDLRVVAATGADLPAQIDAGGFRRDLYYRLAGFVARVPPLRERPEDVAPLVEHLLQRYTAEAGRRVRGVTVGALTALRRHPWRGNVRELEHEVRRLVYLCAEHQVIDRTLLDVNRVDATSLDVAHASSSYARRPRHGYLDLRRDEDLRLERVGQQVVQEALRRVDGNRSAAARLLGISREALRRRLQRYGDQEPHGQD